MKTSNIKEYMTNYYSEHKDVIKERARAYKKNNKEYVSMCQILYNLNNVGNKIRQSTIDKYQIYYDKSDNLFKSKLNDKKSINSDDLKH
jgi:hypothetical protein